MTSFIQLCHADFDSRHLSLHHAVHPVMRLLFYADLSIYCGVSFTKLGITAHTVTTECLGGHVSVYADTSGQWLIGIAAVILGRVTSIKGNMSEHKLQQDCLLQPVGPA